MQECINRHCFYMWILKCKLVFKFSVHLRENRRKMGKFFYIVHKQRLHRLQGELNAVWNQFNRFSVYNAVSHPKSCAELTAPFNRAHKVAHNCRAVLISGIKFSSFNNIKNIFSSNNIIFNIHFPFYNFRCMF